MRASLALTGALSWLSSGCVELAREDVRFQVLTWWQEAAEVSAFQAVLRIHGERFPDVEVERLADGSGEESRARLAHRMLAGAQLMTFQANAGADLLRWATVDYHQDGRLHRESRLRPLNDLFEKHGLFEDVPAPLLEQIRFQGNVYAVPLGIHRLNVLYYSQRARAEFMERNDGRDFTEDLTVLCPEGEAAELLELPTIAVGTGSPFVLTLLTFENVLPALAGGDFYAKLWRGEAPLSSNGGDWTFDVRRALRCVRRLAHSFQPNHASQDWAVAASLVSDGRAAFTVMGDWVGGQLRKQENVDVASVPFPGTRGLFVFTSDTFPLPVDAEYPEHVERLLSTMASDAAQRAFSIEKGSIPARWNVPVEGEALAKRTAFDSGRPLLATSGFFPPYYPREALERALDDLVRVRTDAAEEAVLDLLVNAYPLLRRYQER